MFQRAVDGFQGKETLPTLTFQAPGVPGIMKRGSLQALSKGEVMTMVRPSGSNFTRLCFKRLGILGTPPANHFTVRNIRFGCSGDSSEGFRTLDP